MRVVMTSHGLTGLMVAITTTKADARRPAMEPSPRILDPSPARFIPSDMALPYTRVHDAK